MDLSECVLLRQGAEAKLYEGTFLGQRVLVKHRFPKRYRVEQLDTQLTKDRLRGEVRGLNRAKLLGVRTPTVYLADMDSAQIVLEYLDGAVTARDYIKRLVEAGDREEALAALSKQIGTTFAKLHKANIIHGDLTTSNLMVDKQETDSPELVVIDFGLGYAEGTAEDKGVDLYVLERAFLSTHPNTERLVALIVSAYKAEFGEKKGKKTCDEILRKYEEIRMRGRKRTMVG